METASFGEWRYAFDRDATAQAYSRCNGGYTATCDCSFCRNFIQVRDEVLPPGFLALLNSLGIDPAKDGEVYHEGAVAAQSHYYGGWYHFVGSLESAGDFAPVEFGSNFIAYMCRASAPSLPELREFPLVQIEFRASGAPWRIEDENPFGDA